MRIVKDTKVSSQALRRFCGFDIYSYLRSVIEIQQMTVEEMALEVKRLTEPAEDPDPEPSVEKKESGKPSALDKLMAWLNSFAE